MSRKKILEFRNMQEKLEKDFFPMTFVVCFDLFKMDFYLRIEVPRNQIF